MRFVAGDTDAAVVQTPLESHHGGTVLLIECVLERARDVRATLQRILDLPGARDLLRASLEARTDDDGVFYLRVQKQEAYNGRLSLTTGEDCVQLRLKLEHYPASRDAALVDLARLLDAPRP